MDRIVIKGLSDIERAAEKVIESFGDSKVIALYGEMGAGKTTLIKEICAQLGVKEIVSSPSFAIVNVYKVSGEEDKTVNHFDFYRIRKIEEAFDFGYQEYFFGGDLCLVEWPQMVEELLPQDCLRLEIKIVSPTEREIIQL